MKILLPVISAVFATPAVFMSNAYELPDQSSFTTQCKYDYAGRTIETRFVLDYTSNRFKRTSSADGKWGQSVLLIGDASYFYTYNVATQSVECVKMGQLILPKLMGTFNQTIPYGQHLAGEYVHYDQLLYVDAFNGKPLAVINAENSLKQNLTISDFKPTAPENEFQLPTGIECVPSLMPNEISKTFWKTFWIGI